MFTDREDAGNRLAQELGKYRGAKNALILAIPRGGVAIGSALAKALDLPLDVILTKKIGHPADPEYAIGVVNLSSESIDEAAVKLHGVPRSYLDGEIRRIRRLLMERYRVYRGGGAPPSLRGKTVIIADDGIATGNTMMAAVRTARKEDAARIVVAAPVGSPAAARRLREMADEVVCLEEPDDFAAIGPCYERFDQVGDDEAIRLLRESAAPR